jgi:hypothetical protein
MGFWGENGVKIVTVDEKLARNSLLAKPSGTGTLLAQFSLLAKLSSDSIFCFAF